MRTLIFSLAVMAMIAVLKVEPTSGGWIGIGITWMFMLAFDGSEMEFARRQ